jgi:hypothetical protein
MKQQLNSAWRCNRKTFALSNSLFAFTLLLVSSTLFLSSCQKEAVQEHEEHVSKSAVAESDANVLNHYMGLSFQTKWELQQARAATAKYRNIENAKRDGYVDINVIVPGMGHHFMKPSLVDGTFDIRNPEILVYNKNMDNTYTLVAVEYAVPLSFSRPEGFSGSHDIWDENTGFGLWLLHAWVWKYNSMGVFNSTNPDVHTH